nr:hypothetical protein [Tanacetum cinerariifolium]
MQGTSLTKQERECKLYDEFDKFAYKKGESLREFYLRFLLLLYDMDFYNMKLEQFQVNTKFLNTLPPEWSKFMTGVKLVRDMHTKNVDQLHAYLGQHKFHANEYGSPFQSSQYGSQAQSSTPLSISYPLNDFQSLVHHNFYNPSSSIPQVEYAPSVHQQSDFSQIDSGLIVLVFQKGDDPIDAINHMMSFLTTVYVITNNAAYQADDLDAYDSDCDQINYAKIALMANLSHYGFDNLAESETKITSDSNIIPYSQYVSESQYAAVQNLNLPAQQDALILSVIEQLKTQVVNYTKINQDNKSVNETLTAKLKRYKDQKFVNSEEPNLSTKPTQVKVPKELPKVSMVNSSLKKLKYHVASFDVVVKERTAATAITEGTWGFKHTKAFFRDEIIPFVIALKDLFNSFDQFLINELSEVQDVINQMEQAVEQHRVKLNRFQDKMIEVLNENERLLEQAISKDIVNVVVTANVNNAYEPVNECERCVTLETELQKDFIKKECYDKVFKQYTTLEKHFKEKDMVIMKLKERIKSLSGNLEEETIKHKLEEIKTINIELDHRVTKLVTENEHLK